MTSPELRRQLTALLQAHGWGAVLRALAGCARSRSQACAAGDQAAAWAYQQTADTLRRVADTYALRD